MRMAPAPQKSRFPRVSSQGFYIKLGFYIKDAFEIGVAADMPHQAMLMSTALKGI